MKAVICVALYITDTGEHTVHYKINKDAYTQPQK